MLPGVGSNVINEIIGFLNRNDIQKLNMVCKTETIANFPQVDMFDIPVENIKQTGISLGNNIAAYFYLLFQIIKFILNIFNFWKSLRIFFYFAIIVILLIFFRKSF